jgi:hypothetical protein
LTSSKSSENCNNNYSNQHTIFNIDVLEGLLLYHCKNNGKMLVFNKMKRCKGWAMDFCRRHSFDRAIITIVGSSRSKATKKRFKKASTVSVSSTTLLLKGEKSEQDCFVSSVNALCDVAYGLLDLKKQLHVY